jgi:hypothetical protein
MAQYLRTNHAFSFTLVGVGLFTTFATKQVSPSASRKRLTYPRKPINDEHRYAMRQCLTQRVRPRAFWHHTLAGGSQLFCDFTLDRNNIWSKERTTPTKIFANNLVHDKYIISTHRTLTHNKSILRRLYGNLQVRQ